MVVQAAGAASSPAWHTIAGSLLGSNTRGQNQAICFQQYGSTTVGATESGPRCSGWGRRRLR
jgi:hypothetical protein